MSVLPIRRRASSTSSASTSDLPIGSPAAARKVLAMPPPTISRSTLARQRVEHRELGGHLGAADDGHQRARRLRERLAERLELGRQQRPGAGDRREARHAVRRGLGAVRGGEGVHHVDVAERGHAARERLVVLLLALDESHVLGERHLARGDLDAFEPVAHQRHRPAQQLRQPRRDRRQAERRVLLVAGTGLRAPEVRHHQQSRAAIEREADRGQRGQQARVAGDAAVLHRHVQVFADQDALAAQIELGHQFHGHCVGSPASGVRPTAGRIRPI
jgi:hypothetical protein